MIHLSFRMTQAEHPAMLSENLSPLCFPRASLFQTFGNPPRGSVINGDYFRSCIWAEAGESKDKSLHTSNQSLKSGLHDLRGWSGPNVHQTRCTLSRHNLTVIPSTDFS